MNPWMSQAVAEEHRRDLRRMAEQRNRRTDARRQHKQHQEQGNAHRTSWDAKVGWLLIRVGCRLVAMRANPAEVTAVHTAHSA